MLKRLYNAYTRFELFLARCIAWFILIMTSLMIILIVTFGFETTYYLIFDTLDQTLGRVFPENV